jgi:hypothetical protein
LIGYPDEDSIMRHKHLTKIGVESEKLEKAKVRTDIETKCPIIRSSHTSPGSDFALSPYHIESIQPGTNFGFRCIIEDVYVDELKEVLHEAGVFSGIGGFRSRGYGTVVFRELEEVTVDEIIKRRAIEIGDISDKLIVTNSQMILQQGDNSVIGFDAVFGEYASKTSTYAGYDLSLRCKDEDGPHQKISEGIARGWSLKYGNRVSKIIPCIGQGSCTAVTANNNKALAALEIYGVGEMTNSGYGDVYVIGGEL